MRVILGLAAAAALVGAPALAADPLRAAADAARDAGLKDPTAYQLVESISTDVGPRLAGSEAAARARDWGVARLKALGFSNVHVEPFPITAWARGAEEATLTAPYAERLAILGLGGSVPTPPDGVEGEAVVFRSYADLLAAPPGSLAGKIAVVTQGMARTDDGAGYGAANPIRRSGASEAARRGAVAYLIRSLATGVSREPHTGALNYAADAPKIPAAALSVIDAQLLDRLAAEGAPIRIRLKLASASGPATGWTVVGEIPGREHPDQVILIGGHLDSWDPGTGSIDDGAGIAIAVGAAHVATAGHPLKRTVRVAMFGAEEMDFTNAAFTAAHKAEVPGLVAVGEIDEGADNVWKVDLPEGAGERPQMKTLAASLAPLKIFVSPDPAKFGGSDIRGLAAAGAPVVVFHQDASRYFDWHHTSEDTLDKVDPVQMNQNVAAWAAFLTIVGDSDVDLRPAPALPTAQAKP
ncbi:MAG: M28 family peptidase [Caulobacteraceae bacterium]|nr:M28 family peptidase [Caulobacteraceae bacterium]